MSFLNCGAVRPSGVYVSCRSASSPSVRSHSFCFSGRPRSVSWVDFYVRQHFSPPRFAYLPAPAAALSHCLHVNCTMFGRAKGTFWDRDEFTTSSGYTDINATRKLPLKKVGFWVESPVIKQSWMYDIQVRVGQSRHWEGVSEKAKEAMVVGQLCCMYDVRWPWDSCLIIQQTPRVSQ